MAKATKKVTQIEQDLMSAFKLKRKGNEDDQKWFKRLAVSGQAVEAAEWQSLPEPAQEWCNKAIEAIEAGKDIPAPEDEDEDIETEEEEDDIPGAGDDDDDEEEEEEEEEEKPKRNRKARAKKDEEDEESDESDEEEGDDAEDAGGEDPEEDESDERGEQEEDDDDDEDDEDEDEDVKPKKAAKGKNKPTTKKKVEPKKTAKSAKDKDKPKGTPGRKSTGGGAQGMLKRLIIEDPTRTTNDIVGLLLKAGFEITPVACSTIRSGMLQSLRLLKEMGKLKGVAGL